MVVVFIVVVVVVFVVVVLSSNKCSGSSVHRCGCNNAVSFAAF